jgi:hypothetical protein
MGYLFGEVAMITTERINPPVPSNKYDWRASVDGEEDAPIGFGTTETEALRDLCEQLAVICLEAPDTSGVREIFLEQERDEARRGLVAIRTQVANALTDIEDGNEDDAMEMLRAIAGR